MSSSHPVIEDVVSSEFKKLQAILDDALKSSVGIVDAKLREVNRKIEELEKTLNSQITGVRERILSSAELEAKSKLLRVFEEKVNEVLGEALNEIANMPRDEGYEEVIEKLILEAVSIVGSDAIVVPAKRDEDVVKKVVRRLSRRKTVGYKIQLSEKRLDSVGGVLVESVNGQVSYNNTFEARLSRVADEVKRMLFEAVTGE